MKTAVPFALVAALTLSGEAPPPRPVHLDIVTAQSVDILVSCIKQKISGLRVNEVPLDNGGMRLEFGEQKTLLMHKPPMEYWDIVRKPDANHVTVSYRHPMSEKTAAKDLRIVGRKCFPYELDAAGGGKLPDATG